MPGVEFHQAQSACSKAGFGDVGLTGIQEEPRRGCGA